MHQKSTAIFITLLGFIGSADASARSRPRSFLFALPLTVGSPLKLSYNYESKVALSLDITNEPELERLSDREVEESPGSSLLTEAQEVGLMFSRYSNAANMSGWHWGLGVGYKRMKASWVKLPDPDAEGDEAIVTEDGRANYKLDISGTTATARGGYRYVADELGFMASLFLMIKHFQNRVQDAELDGTDTQPIASITRGDAQTIRRRFTTQILPGLEVGWAF